MDKFYHRLWYAARRHGLTLARPIEYRANVDRLKPPREEDKIVRILRATPLFGPLEDDVIQELGAGATEHHYAVGEFVIHQGEADEGFYLVQAGEVTMSAKDKNGNAQEIAHLKAGDFFGELALLKNEPSPISAQVVTDVDLLIIEGKLITQLIETHPQFARELNFFIEKRQTLLNAISETENGRQPHTARRDWLDVAKNV